MLSSAGFDVVGASSLGTEAHSTVAGLTPDIVLVDVAGGDSLSTVRALAASGNARCIIALAVPELEAEVVAYAEAGVAGYLGREGSREDLVDVIDAASRGELVCTPRLAGALLRRVAATASQERGCEAIARLTRREREIAALLSDGLSNKQISGRLTIEVTTVKNHVHSILEKLGVQRRGEAAARLRHKEWT